MQDSPLKRGEIHVETRQSSRRDVDSSRGGGRYGRVFIGTNDGWFAGTGVVPTVEELTEHLDEIRDVTEYVIPGDINEELMILARLAGG